MIKPRVYLEYFGPADSESDRLKLYLDWYRHSKSHKYRGFTMNVSVLGYMIGITLVNDAKLYQEVFGRYEK